MRAMLKIEYNFDGPSFPDNGTIKYHDRHGSTRYASYTTMFDEHRAMTKLSMHKRSDYHKWGLRKVGKL